MLKTPGDPLYGRTEIRSCGLDFGTSNSTVPVNPDSTRVANGDPAASEPKACTGDRAGPGKRAMNVAGQEAP
jgi:hypothetical protein